MRRTEKVTKLALFVSVRSLSLPCQRVNVLTFQCSGTFSTDRNLGRNDVS